MTPDDKHRRRLELVLEGTRLGMWDWNPQTNEVVFDARWAEMLGHTLDEIEPGLESWSSRVHPDDLDACYADIQAHIEGRTPFYENVHRMRHKDGYWVHILDRGRIAERDEQGRPTRFTGTHTDISAQREAEQQALALARGRTRFLATMSHEIRTPMHGILGLLDVISDGPLTTIQREALAVVRRSGESLIALVNDILDFSKASEGHLELSPEPFHLVDLLHEVAALHRDQTPNTSVPLVVDFDPAVGTWVMGDGYRLRQVVSNLLSNAVKFTERGAVLVTTTRRASDGLVDIAVRDTGRGIADTAAIFNPYDQAGAATAKHFGGTGLGLSIVKHLVELMGGTITVESTLGIGSCFTVTLPLPITPAPRPDAEPVVPVEGLSHLRVLIAEDNPVNQMVVRHLLGSLVAHLDIVDDGRQAVERVMSGDYDVLLLDLNMPELDGDSALRQLRRQGRTVPAIAATADAMTSTRKRCEDAGFEGFLPKPFRRDQLIDAVTEVLKQPC